MGGNNRLTHLQALHSALEEEKQCRVGEFRPRCLDQPLRRVCPRLEVGAVEAEEWSDDCVKPEQGESEEKKVKGEKVKDSLLEALMGHLS